MIGKKLIKNIRSGMPGKISHSEKASGIEYYFNVEDIGQYSLVISEIGIMNTKLGKPISIDRFKNQVQEIENRLSYFPEHPKLIELNEKDLIAQLRSNLPEKEDNTVKYFEILFSKGKKINFYRIANKTGKSEKINMVIPDDTFTHLLNDLTDIVN